MAFSRKTHRRGLKSRRRRGGSCGVIRGGRRRRTRRGGGNGYADLPIDDCINACKSDYPAGTKRNNCIADCHEK